MRKGEGSHRTWPIWSDPLTLHVFRPLLALERLRQALTDPVLRAMGIVEIYRALRQTRDKKRSSTPAWPI
jgi:hypothetical protein